MRERKTFELTQFKDSGDGAGSFEGRASTFNTIDSYGDTIEAGAYKNTIPDFLKRGFISWGHDWNEPIGMVTSAEEKSDGLYISGEFHSDPQSQRRRQIAVDRVSKGQFMGLSIGYEPLETEERTVEEPFRGAWGELTDKVRVLKKIKLYEVSLVMVPAEANSGLTAIKSHDLSFNERTLVTREALQEWISHLEATVARDVKVGRAISQARLEELQALRETWVAGLARLDAVLAQPASENETNEAAEETPVVGLTVEKAAEIPEDLELLIANHKRIMARWASEDS